MRVRVCVHASHTLNFTPCTLVDTHTYARTHACIAEPRAFTMPNTPRVMLDHGLGPSITYTTDAHVVPVRLDLDILTR